MASRLPYGQRADLLYQIGYHHRLLPLPGAAMKAFLSPLLHLDPGRIAIKATTMEKLGAIGRKEGIMAYATVTVRLP